MIKKSAHNVRRFSALFTALLLLFCAVPAASAAEDSSGLSPDAALDSGSFEPITRQAYISTKAQQLGISYAEAEAIVDDKIAAAKSSLTGLAPCSWEGDHTETNPDGTFTIYGRVSFIHEDPCGLEVICDVQAVMIASHYGKTWVDCNENGQVLPYGSGTFTFIGSCSASIVSTTELRIAASGNFEIAEEVMDQLDVNAEFFGYSHSVGTTRYYRCNTYFTHIEPSM